jgi:hypothetical protein
MAIESVQGRVVLLLVCNSPILIGFGSIFFSSWGNFFGSFTSGYEFGPLSWILGRHWVMTWENSKLFLFFVLIALALYGEYRFFWPNPPTSIQGLSLQR